MTATRTVTVLATDLVGSTAQRADLGEDMADELRRRHDAQLADAISEHAGEVVKGMGDGLLACFDGAAGALAAAESIQQRVDGEFNVRIGVSAGDVVFEDGDVFGTPVIEAVRLCDEADGGQVLLADVVRTLSRGRGGHHLEPIGALELKGLPEPVTTLALRWKRTGRQLVPLPGALHRNSRLPFAGRETLVSELTEWLKRSDDGSSHVMLLSGEPGIGKTRVLTELAERAYADGTTVLFGRGEQDVASPYRAFADAFEPLVDHAPEELLLEHLDHFGGALGRVVPRLARRVPAITVPSGSSEELRALEFDAVVDLLSRSGDKVPLLVTLDDLQWADESSLLLFRHLAVARDLRHISIVGCFRDTDLRAGHRLKSVLADLRSTDDVQRTALAGLGEAEVGDLMAAAAGHELDARGRELARVVWSATGGNAFFVSEVLVHLAESGAIYEDGGRWVSDVTSVADIRVPAGLREVVERRLDTLSDTANDILRAGAVMGEEMDLPVLAIVSGLSEDDVLDELENAMERGLVDEVPGSVDRLRFRHALLRQTISEGMSTMRRVRLHAGIGDACAQTRRAEPARRAHHLLAAADILDVEAATAAVLEVVRDALTAHAWETAVDWAQRAMEVLSARLGDSPTSEYRLLTALADALVDGGDFRSARDVLVEAAGAARRSGDGKSLARLAGRYATAGAGWLDHHDRFGPELVDEADASLPPGESAERAGLLLARAQLAFMSPDSEPVTELARRGLEMTRRVAPHRLGEALLVFCESMRGTHDVDALLSAALEGRRLGHEMQGYSIMHFEILARINLGRFGDVEHLARESDAAGRRLRNDVFRWHGHSARVCVHSLFGRWDDAEVELEMMQSLGEQLGDSGVGTGLYAEQFLACRRRDFARLRAVNDRMITRVPQLALSPRDAVIGAFDGSMSPEELRTVAADWFSLVPLLPHWVERGSLAWMAPVMRHAPPHVAAAADAVMEPSDRLWIAAGIHETQGHCAWVRGALAEAQRDLDAAIAHYSRARDIHAEAGELPIRANNLVWLVEALLERDGPGDRDEAERRADESAAIGERLAMTGLSDTVTSLVR